MSTYLFTSESVSEGHPDKICDQISDAILDEFLRRDPESKVACESFCTTGNVVVMGEVHSEACVDVQDIVRGTIARIGYTKADYGFEAQSCGVLSSLHEQSGDIRRGVDDPLEQGAGDQGMMFGYACSETEVYLPLPLYLSHLTLRTLADIRRKSPELMPYLRPDAKSQYTIEYDAVTGKPLRVHTIVLSTQHDEFAAPSLGRITYAEACAQFGPKRTDEAMHDKIEADVREILLPRVIAQLSQDIASLFKDDFILHVNPTGKFVIGGPAGDTGLTGRKIIVDTYGGRGAHGGGAFSGKDPSKVDRSAAYAARHIAKNMVAAGVASEILVQVAYSIGVARPVSIAVNTYGTASEKVRRAAAEVSGHTSGVAAAALIPDAEVDAYIASRIPALFDLRPASIIRRFGLKNPIYTPTAAYGHFGRKPYTEAVTVYEDGVRKTKAVEFFGWEKIDSVDAIRAEFGL